MESREPHLRQGIIKFFFWYDGRVSCGQLVFGHFIAVLAIFLALNITTPIDDDVDHKGLSLYGMFDERIASVLFLAGFYSLFCLHTKRWHDLGRSGFYPWIPTFSPFAGIRKISSFWFEESVGLNPYGPSVHWQPWWPRLTATGVIFLAALLACGRASFTAAQAPGAKKIPDIEELWQSAKDEVSQTVPSLAAKPIVEEADFEQAAQRDATEYAIQSFDPKVLKARQEAAQHLQKPLLLAIGQRKTLGPLDLQVKQLRIAQHRGATKIQAEHLVLQVTNRSRLPVAYWLKAHKEGQDECTNRGVVQANPIALAPQEVAHLSICAGVGRVEVTQARTMSISQLGYHYLSMLPPQVLGIDAVTARSHRSAKSCTTVPINKLQIEVNRKNIRWEDIVDFYSRHSCQRMQMPLDYRYTGKALETLPFATTLVAEPKAPTQEE